MVMRINLTVITDSELKKKVKAYCALKGFMMSDVVSKFFRLLLEDKEFEEVFVQKIKNL